MIIFYDKKTGDIRGTIDGRIHTDIQKKMWIGDKKKTDRIIIEWEVVGEQKLKNGEVAKVWEPKEQKKIISNIEARNEKIQDYKVDTKTKKLIKK